MSLETAVSNTCSNVQTKAIHIIFIINISSNFERCQLTNLGINIHKYMVDVPVTWYPHQKNQPYMKRTSLQNQIQKICILQEFCKCSHSPPMSHVCLSPTYNCWDWFQPGNSPWWLRIAQHQQVYMKECLKWKCTHCMPYYISHHI